ncbi:MAG: hypothetical protein AAF531_18225 [Actinomycetota bacterium]
MARLNHDELTAAIAEKLSATPDPSGAADLICDRGAIVVAADPDSLKAAFKRAKKIDGYRWVAINRSDLFAANPLSLGSKAGIFDQSGEMLKNADVPRRKV